MFRNPQTAHVVPQFVVIYTIESFAIVSETEKVEHSSLVSFPETIKYWQYGHEYLVHDGSLLVLVLFQDSNKPLSAFE